MTRFRLALILLIGLWLVGFASLSSGQGQRGGNSFSVLRSFSLMDVQGFLNLNSRPTITVNGATTFAATTSYFILECTGAETINTITAGSKGMVLVIENSDTECTIADDDSATASNAIDLTGVATNDVGAVAKVVVLLYNGTHWLQVAESDN